MARLARIVAPGIPHHITQRGNRRMQTFFHEADYREYLSLMAQHCSLKGVTIWCYCLMPNHVHLIAVPETEDSLRGAIGEAHRRYTRYINFRKGWRGHLWQERFSSFPMDERHLLAAARYIERNPVRARLIKSPGDYPWSSASAHLSGRDDLLVQVSPLLGLVDDWAGYLSLGVSEQEFSALKRHERTGRPMGDDGFIKTLENSLSRCLTKQKPGPKRK